MAIKLGFQQQINVSVTKDDLVYFTDTLPFGGYNTADLDDLVLIGPILSVNRRSNLYSSNTEIFEVATSQLDLDLNIPIWQNSNNVPVDTDDFLLKINGVLNDPILGVNPFTITSGVITFTNPITALQTIEVQLLYTITVDDTNFVAPPSPVLNSDSFIMFKKNEIINMSGVKGYYAEVKFKNNSTEKTELFAVSSEIVQSSK
jgi:hypothetical protein